MSVYVIGRITVSDPAEYQNYSDQTAALVRDHGGLFLAKGGEQDVLEGNCPARHVIIEFPSRAAALEWYNCAAYRRILPIALNSSERDIVIVDGV